MNHFSVEHKTGEMWKDKEPKNAGKICQKSHRLVRFIALQKHLTPERLDLKH